MIVGDESASKFSVTWSPRKVKIGDTTTIDTDFTACKFWF